LELATKFYEIQLWKGDGKEKILNYLKSRGLNDQVIKEFRLGYAPKGWTNVLGFLTGRAYKSEEIAKTGLLVEKKENKSSGNYYDRFRERIIFPIVDVGGKIVGFSARVAPGGDESQAKYVNTPETEVYHKSKVLYGINLAKNIIREKDYVLLVEGNMDAIACHQVGMKNTLAVSGTALTQDQINTIKRYTSNIKMFFDMDSAGEAATKKSIKLCFNNDITVKVVELPEGKDAAELAKADPGKLKKAVAEAKHAMEYFFEKIFSKYDKNKVEDKRTIAEELLSMIGQLANDIEKSHWLKKLGERLNIEESVLTGLLKKATIQERMGEKIDNKEESISFISKEKIEVLIEELIGLMLSYKEVWKNICAIEYRKELAKRNEILDLLMAKGSGLGYDFDRLLKAVGEQEAVAKIERIFFEKKYRLNLNNQLEEILIQEPWQEAKRCLKDINREINKKELEKICADLKIAEERKDKEAIQFLKDQFNKISQDLIS